MRGLLCLLALALVLHPVIAQSFVATAATSKVQQRVSEILQAGGRLTPESLLHKSSTVSAAAYSKPAHDAASKRVQIAGINSDSYDMPEATGELQSADEDGVQVAAKEVHIKWDVRQVGQVTLEPQDDKLDSETPNTNESAELIRRQSSMQKRQTSEQADGEFVKVTPGTQGHSQDSRELSEVPQDSSKGSVVEDAPSSGRDKDSLQGISAKDAELLQRLTNVDWEAVLAAAAKDTEAEERAASAKRNTLTEARNAELKRRVQLAAAAKQQAELERQQLTAERKEALQAIKKATGELQLAEELKKKAAAVRQQIEAAREYSRELRDAEQEASYDGSSSSSKYGGNSKPKYSQSSHSHDSYKRQEKDGYGADASYPDSDGYDEEDDYPNRVKVTVYEKNRSQPRYFPGGGMYSFTSELTCTTAEEAKAKLTNRAFPLLTPRMTKTTVGLCEWTVAEGDPTKVNKNVFLLGNGWATCTFLPIATKLCSKPISGGLTLTIQALMYQFAQPQGIREPDAEEYGQAAVKTVDVKSAAGSAGVSIASVNLLRRQPTATKPSVLVAKVAPAATKLANGTAAARTQGAATAAAQGGRKSDNLLDVELQNVFLGLITGAHGPKKSHKYKSGAVQYVFGAPLETDGSDAVETQMLPSAADEPSLAELQGGLPQLVPGTYQFAFDEE